MRSAPNIVRLSYQVKNLIKCGYNLSTGNNLCIPVSTVMFMYDQDEAEELFQEGQRLLRDGRFQPAVDLFWQAVNADPDHCESWYYHASAIYVLCEHELPNYEHGYEHALESYEKFLDLALDNFEIDEEMLYEAYFHRGTIYFRFGKEELALESLDEALNIEPNSAQALLLRGIILSNLQKYELALISLEKSSELEPGNFTAWYYKGNVFYNFNQSEPALESYEKALGLDSNYPKAWFQKALCLEKMGQYEEAVKSFEQALQLNPRMYEAWYERGMNLGRLGRDQEAIDSFDKCLAIEPNYPYALQRKGQALEFLGRYHEAYESIYRLTRVAPFANHVWIMLGGILQRLQRYDAAMEVNNMSVALINNDWCNAGVMFFNLERYQDAIFCFERSLKEKPGDCKAWEYRILSLEALGKHEEKQSCLEQAWRKGCLLPSNN